MATTDARRFHRLIEPHLEALFRAGYRLAGNRADAEDLVQDTCIRAFERVTELQESRPIKAWLLSVLFNRFVDGSRRAERSPIATEFVTAIDRSVCPEPSPEERVMNDQSEEALHRAWLMLEPSQQALLALRAEGYSSAEISEITEVPIDALYGRLYRARLNLAQHLKHPSVGTLNHRLEIAK